MRLPLTPRATALAILARRGRDDRRRPRVRAWPRACSPASSASQQRHPYYAAHAAGARWPRSRRRALARVGLWLLAALFLVSAGLGVYHAGVEWGWLAGPSDCGGTPAPAPGQRRRFPEPARDDPGRELHGGGLALPRPVARRLERADLARRLRRLAAAAAAGAPEPLRARARCPSRDSRASSRAGSSAGTAGRSSGGRAGSARRALCRGHISTSRGRRSPLRRLQGEQAATTFSQVVCPPLERGITWSKVRSSRSPQYWQVKRSRRKTLKRVKAGCREGLT